MSKEDIADTVNFICNALTMMDIEKVLALFTDDATLVWGTYSFTTKQEIKRWAIGLRELFPKMNIKQMSLKIQDNKANHLFIIEIILPDGRIGLLPCKSEYEFKNGKINHVKFTISHGYISEK